MGVGVYVIEGVCECGCRSIYNRVGVYVIESVWITSRYSRVDVRECAVDQVNVFVCVCVCVCACVHIYMHTNICIERDV